MLELNTSPNITQTYKGREFVGFKPDFGKK